MGERPAGRYLDRFEQIRRLQEHLVSRARAAGVPLVENDSIDRAVGTVMELVLAAVERRSGSGGR